MKTIFILLFAITLYADLKSDMFALYQNEKYKDVCNKGFANLYPHKNDEQFVTLYALACLKSDHIDRLSIPIAILKHSPEARSNSAYFSVILMQKKLLYHSLVDNYDLSAFKLPTTDYVLSKVFDLYSKIPPHAPRAYYLLEDENDTKLNYKLYISTENKIDKIIIEEFYDTIKIKHHIYW